MSDDRYGISAYFEFVEKSGSIATIDRVESALKRLETTVKGTSQVVSGAHLGQNIGQQFKGVQGAIHGASNSVQEFKRSASQAGSALTPLRSEFRALKAESRNIDFGDLKDPQVFNAARQSLHKYVAELQKLHDQIEGNTTADRQFKAELSRNQTIATQRGEIAEIQRSSAISSQRAGAATAVAGSAAAVALPMVGVGTAAVNITAGFDDQMSAVAAVLSAQDRTAENMLKLREQAKSIGASTKFSATDAASGLVLLAQSGQTVEEQLKSIAGTTLLAAAGGLDLAAATDITVASLGQFGLKADQAVHVANVLAYNAGAANLGVADLGESLKYAGPAASKFGASFEETNAILDVFSESGIKGSAAGTALRTMFINMASPSRQAEDMLNRYNITVKDSAGNMLPTIDVMEQLQSKLSGISSGDQLDVVSTIFGKEATPAALSIVNGGATKMKGYLQGGKDADTVKGSNGAIGSAAVQAGIMENNIGGSFRNLSSAIEGVQIEMGEILVPTIRAVVDTLAGLLTRFIELPKPIKTAITVTAALVTGIAAVTAVVASAAAVFFTLQSAIGASAIATTLMSSTLVPLTGFASAVTASFGASGFAGVLGVVTGGIAGLGAAIGAFATGALVALTSPVAIATAGVLALYGALEILTPGFNVLGAVISTIAAPIGFVFGLAKGIATGIATALAPVLSQFAGLRIAGTGIGEAFNIAGKAFSNFAAIGSAVGNAIGLVLGVVIVYPLTKLITLFKLAAAAAETVGKAGALIASPFIFAVQSIGAAWSGFTSWFMSMPLVKFAQDLGTGLINALNHNPTVKIPIAWKGAMKAITGMFTGLLAIGKIIGTKLITAFNPIGIIQMLPGAIGGILESFAGLIFGAFSIIGSAVMGAISSPVMSVLAVGATVVEGLKAIWTGFTSWLTGALMAVPNAVGESFSKILPPFLRNKKENQVSKIAPDNAKSATESSVVPLPTPIEKKNTFSIARLFNQEPKVEGPNLSPIVNPTESISPIAPAMPIQSAIASKQINPAQILPKIQAMAVETSSVVQANFDKLDLTTAIATAKTSFDGFGSVVKSVQSQFGGLAQGALMFGVTSLLSLSPTVLVFGGIALAIAVVTSNFLGLRTIAIGIGKVFAGLFETLRGIVEVLGGITRAVGAVGSGVSGIIGGIPAALKGDFSVIENAFNDMTAGLKVGFNSVLSGAGRVGAGIEEAFSGVLQIAKGVGEGIGQVVNGITATIKAIPTVISSVAGAIESSWKAVSGFVSGLQIEPSIEFLKSLPSKVSELFDRVKDTVKGAVEYVQNLSFMPSIEDLKTLPSSVSALFERIVGFTKGAVDAIGNLPFIPSIEQLKTLPVEVSHIIDRVSDFIKSGVSAIGNLPFIPSIEAIQSLPSKVSEVFDRVTASVKNAIGFVSEIWQSLRLLFPEINLQNISEIPSRIGAMIDSAVGFFRGGVEQISAVWGGLRSIDNMPLLEGTINLLKSLPVTFEAVVEKIKGLWGGLGEKFGGILGGMGDKAKSIGKSFVSALSENSPGPTYQIRMKWESTTAAIGEQLEHLKGEAKIKGQHIADNLSGPLSAAKSKGAAALGRSASSVGMVLSNFAPNLAAPLFAIGDMVDTVETLSDSLPEAKKFFSGLGPEVGKLGGSLKGMLPLLGDGVMAAGGKASAMIVNTLIPNAIAMGSSFVAMAGSAMAAIAPLVIPFLPVIAIIGGVIGTIALLKAAFNSDFLGIKTLVFGVGDAITSTFTNAFGMVTSVIFGFGETVKSTISAAFATAFGLVGSVASGAVMMLTGLWDGFAGWIVDRFMAIPNAIGGALSSLVPDFLKKKDPADVGADQSATAVPVMNPIAAAATRVQGAWTGFGAWFKGSMGGLVAEGEGAGEGLVNALNHNPTVRIPIAWQGATDKIGGMLSGILEFGRNVGSGLASLFGGAASFVGGAFKQLGSVVTGFGLGSLVSLFPALAVMGGLALVTLAISTNFLGLRTIATGIFSAISGAIEGAIATIRGFVEVVRGAFSIIQGIILGDVSLIASGFDRLFEGIHAVVSGIASAIRSVFGGAFTFVQGIFEGFGKSGKETFIGFETSVQSLGATLKSAVTSPVTAWNGFLDILDLIQAKIQSVGSAIASSPLGTLAGGLKAKFGGKSTTVESGVDGVQFDQKVAAIDAPETPKVSSQIRSFFRRNQTPEVPGVPVMAGATESLMAPEVPFKSNVAEQVRSVFSGNKTGGTLAAPETLAVSAPLAGAKGTLGNATEALGSLGSVFNTVAPNLAGPLNAVAGFLFAITSLTTAIPLLMSTVGSLIAGATGLGTSFMAAGGLAGLFTAGMAALSSMFAVVTATAATAWAAIVGPLLPIIAGIGLAAAAVGALYLAFSNNFLGIASLVSGAVGIFTLFTDAVGEQFSEIFGGIADQWDRSVGGIFTQLGVLGQTLLKPFQPLMALFGSTNDGIGGAIAGMVSIALVPLKSIATAIGFIVGVIGKVVEAVVSVGTVIVDIVLQPVSAIVGVIATVFNAVGRLGAAIMKPFSALGDAWNKLTGGIQGAGDESIQFGDTIRAIANVALLPLRLAFGAIGLAISGVGFVIESIINGFTLMAEVALFPVTAIGFLINGIISVGAVIGTALVNPIGFVTELISGFIGLLASVPSILLTPFSAISGIIGGIAAAIAAVGSAIAGIPFVGGIFSSITGVQAAPQQEKTQYFAEGGMVQGSGIGDRVPARLTPGEFVVTPGPAAASLPLLEALNAGGVQGMLAAMPATLPQIFPAPVAVPVAAGATAGGFGDISVNLNVQNITVSASGGAGDSPQAQAMEILDQLAPHLRRAVADILRDLVEKTR